MSKEMEVEYKFNVTGSFMIDKKLEPVVDSNGNVVAFKRPDGTVVQLVVGLEKISADETKFTYLTSEVSFRQHGFHCLDYEDLNFEKV